MENRDLLKKDDLLMLEFMHANGFNPNNYSQILELIQSVPDSLSKYLKDYNQFLLSRKVDYSKLDDYDIKGAYGYLKGEEGIVVPKTISADNYFDYHQPKVPYKVYGVKYIYPDISDIDSIVTYHGWSLDDITQLISALYYPTNDYYFGFITDKNDEDISVKISIYRLLLEKINENSEKEHEIVHDTISSRDKELYLIKKKKGFARTRKLSL